MPPQKTSPPFDRQRLEEFMRLALQEAHLGLEEGEIPSGVVVVDSEGTLVSRAHNQVIALSDPTAHAEILALRQAGKIFKNYRLEGLTLISTFEPCPMCLTAAIHARVPYLVFGAPVPKWGALGSFCDLTALPGWNFIFQHIEKGVLEDLCASLIQEFFRKKRAKI
ncbi:MAG: nucleoside deaminase [Deltaproteobacteria bacterium]|jgi:tRNA(adenine34) deaminase|nr:nucleoside deaminase [Deltaproteobacteria bacterium]